MENEIHRTQKLESLGLLVGGIAHNFNNNLMDIMGNISLAKMDCSPTSEIYERLTNAETACMKAKDLSQQFLIFSKGGDPVREPTSTADLIKTNCQLALSGTKSICIPNISDDLWNNYADAGQIGQVLTNLLINADQATPHGGVIKMNCENVIIGNDHEIPLKAGNYVKVSIKDQGSRNWNKGRKHWSCFSSLFYHKGMRQWSRTGLSLLHNQETRGIHRRRINFRVRYSVCLFYSCAEFFGHNN